MHRGRCPSLRGTHRCGFALLMVCCVGYILRLCFSETVLSTAPGLGTSQSPLIGLCHPLIFRTTLFVSASWGLRAGRGARSVVCLTMTRGWGGHRWSPQARPSLGAGISLGSPQLAHLEVEPNKPLAITVGRRAAVMSSSLVSTLHTPAPSQGV